MTTAAPPCKFCQKKGLPILPVRFGVAPTKAYGANHFKVAPPDATRYLGKPPVALDAKETVYTGRRLRAGYLYVYYETYHHWEAFAVDQAGCLSEVPIADQAAPACDRFHAACARDATKVANASVLTIQDPETAGKVWIGYSDAWWTKAVRDDNATAATRKKHMREVDVAGWFNAGKPGGKQPAHSFQVMNVDLMVAEYAMPLLDGALAFASNPYKFHAGDAQALKQECEALAEGKGLVLALEDPVGIATELPHHMNSRWAAFSAPYARQTTVDAGLSQIQAAVERQAEEDLFKAKRQAHMDMLMLPGGDKPMANTALLLPSYRKMVQPTLDETITATELDTARTTAWKKYAAVIDQAKRMAFQSEFKTASAQYDSDWMAPLAIAHAGWMTSAAMLAVFDHHFDPQDINTGVGFTAVFAACIVGTGGYGACLKQYDQWLQAGLAAKNLLWRALTYNHPQLIAKAQATKESAAPKADPWRGLFETYAVVAGKLRLAGEHARKALEAQSAVSALIGELGATFVDTLRQRGAPGDNLMAVLGMHAGMPVHKVEITGTRRDVYRQAYANLEELQPPGMAGDAASRVVALDHRMRVLDAEMKQAGFRMDDKVRSWSLLLDAEAADAAALANLTPATQSAIAVERLKLVSPAPGNIAVSISVDSYAGKVLRFMKTPSLIAPVSALFAVLGWSNALDDERKALKSEQSRALATLAAAYAGLTASAFEVIKVGVEGTAGRKLPLLGPIAEALSGRFLRFVSVGGAGAGAVGMLIVTVVDGLNAKKAWDDGESGMMLLYSARAFMEGVMVASLGWSFWTLVSTGTAAELFGGPAIWVITGCIVVVSIVIDFTKDPKTLEWSKTCFFGSKPGYAGDAWREQKDFASAIAAG